MLDTFFTQTKVRTRMERGPLGPYLVELATLLAHHGYARDTVRRHLHAAEQFGCWLVEQKISLAEVTTAHVDHYLESVGRHSSTSYPRGRLPRQALGVRQLLELLRQLGVLQPEVEPQPLIGVERWLEEFDHHLHHVAGTAPKTRSNYVRYARRFLTDCFGSGEPAWSNPLLSLKENEDKIA